MENVDEKLKYIIKDIMDSDLKDISISVSTNLISDLGFDSISIVSLILEIENAFNIEMDNYDLDIISKFDALCKMIEKAINNEETCGF